MNMSSNMTHVMHRAISTTISTMNHTIMNHTMMNHTGGHHHPVTGHGGTHHPTDHAGTHHPTGNHDGTHHAHGTGHGTGHSMGNGHMMGGHSIHNGGHEMYFSFSSSATILFKEWDIDSTRGMVWSCFVVFFMAILYEGFKVFREVLREKYGRNQKGYNVKNNGHMGNGPYNTTVYTSKNRFLNWHHFLQSFLHIIQVAFSYFLMLIAMTFNGWLFIAVCVGAGCGYLLFSWRVKKSYDANEHCH